MTIKMNRWLWALWGAMIVSMILRRQADTYMIVALIILPILIVLLDLHEEISILKEENKHQRKFVMDRYNVLQERLNDVSDQIETRLVVDFAEFAKNNPVNDEAESGLPLENPDYRRSLKRKALKKKRRRELEEVAEQEPVDFNDIETDEENSNNRHRTETEEDFLDEEYDYEEEDEEDFEDI
ncbi:MAG: hypothetical protein ACQETH_09650 [Candidatus Rifleibacteriota bacterium]